MACRPGNGYPVLDVPTTPILSLQQPQPKKARRWLSFLIGIFLGLSVVPILIFEDANELPNWHWPAFNAIILIPALYVAVVAHELGHLIAGKLAGFDLGGLTIGGFALFKSGKRWKFRVRPTLCVGGQFCPRASRNKCVTSRYAWMVAGGPLASLLLSAIALIVTIHWGNGAWRWIGTFFWASLTTLISSIIPYTSALQRSDGAILLLTIRHPPKTGPLMALIAIQSQDFEGVRPREWDREMFDRMLTAQFDSSEFFMSQYRAYYRKLDQGSVTEALEHLENALARSAGTPAALQHGLFLEASAASALLHRKAEQAYVWRDRACALRKPESLDVVQAAIDMCEGRYEDAAQLWAAAGKRAEKKGLDSGMVRFAREKWAEYEAVCREAANPSTRGTLEVLG